MKQIKYNVKLFMGNLKKKKLKINFEKKNPF